MAEKNEKLEKHLKEWAQEIGRENIETYQVVVLNIEEKEIKGHLDLRDFVNLEKLWCSNNEITSLDLSNCPKLTKIDVKNNNINQDLNTFSHLTKLERVVLAQKEKSTSSFFGSLEALKNWKNLEHLDIENNLAITEGLEHVPTRKLEHFYVNGTTFEQTLNSYCKKNERLSIGIDGVIALKRWKKKNGVSTGFDINRNSVGIFGLTTGILSIIAFLGIDL